MVLVSFWIFRKFDIKKRMKMKIVFAMKENDDEYGK